MFVFFSLSELQKYISENTIDFILIQFIKNSIVNQVWINLLLKMVLKITLSVSNMNKRDLFFLYLRPYMHIYVHTVTLANAHLKQVSNNEVSLFTSNLCKPEVQTSGCFKCSV